MFNCWRRWCAVTAFKGSEGINMSVGKRCEGPSLISLMVSVDVKHHVYLRCEDLHSSGAV